MTLIPFKGIYLALLCIFTTVSLSVFSPIALLTPHVPHSLMQLLQTPKNIGLVTALNAGISMSAVCTLISKAKALASF